MLDKCWSKTVDGRRDGSTCVLEVRWIHIRSPYLSLNQDLASNPECAGEANLLVDGVEGIEQLRRRFDICNSDAEELHNRVLRVHHPRIEGCTAIRDDKVTIMIGFRSGIGESLHEIANVGEDDVAAQSKILSVGGADSRG